MNKQELITRWETIEGKLQQEAIISCLTKGISLSSIPNLGKNNGRWDLRGTKLSILQKKREINIEQHKLIQKSGSLKLKNTVLKDIDFSFSNLSYSLIEKCKIQNCVFEETKAKEVTIYASDFNECLFIKTDFSSSFMNENIGQNSGSFKKTEFIETNLEECSFCFPLIENCSFKNCKLYATNFNGSRISNSKFTGLLDSPIFCGYPKRINKSLFLLFNRINPEDYFNPMLNVDFSEAKLIGVSFINGIDLHNCIFPNDKKNYIFIKDIHKTFVLIRNFVENNWDETDKRKALNLIEYIYLSKDRQDQRMDLIDKFLLIDDGRDEKFGNLFFNLIVEFNN